MASGVNDKKTFAGQLITSALLVTSFTTGCASLGTAGRDADFPEQRAQIEQRLEEVIVAAENKDFNRLDSYHLYGPKFTKFTGSSPARLDAAATRKGEHDGLASLKPTGRPDGVHTAGTSSQIADGAGAVLLMTREKAAALGLEPRATIVDACLVGCDPVLMLEGPIPATRRLLDRNGLSMSDIDVFEINEAFAAVVLAWERELKADLDRVNPNGGAIAIGHPLGGTGAILLTKALYELERSEGEHAIVSMCCGGGLGTGTLLRRG